MKQLLRCLLFILFAVTLLSVNVYSQTATVTSDKPDYAPLSDAIFTGSGFAPNEDVVLKVKNMTQPCNTTFADSSYMPWTVTADALGNFTTNWTVCNCAGDSLKLIAKGQTSGLIAVVKFSDGNVRFTTVGLPAGVSVTVSYSYPSVTGSITWTSTGNSSNISPTPANGTTFTYTFPATLISGGDTYTLSPAGSQTASIGNGQNTFTGTYFCSSCVGGLLVTAPTCAQGGTFKITYSPASGSDITVTANTPASFSAKKNTNYSITTIASTVNGNTYTGSATVTGTTPNTSNYSATVNLPYSDNTPPVQPTIADATGECSATATAPTTTDNCAGTITGTTSDALTYNTQGTHVITWTFSDGNGNSTTATQNVVVKDVTPPVQPTIADATGECSATATAPTTTDNCAGTITGTTSDALTYNTQGTYTVHWNFDDGHGNISHQNQTVIVKDVTKPTWSTASASLDRTVYCGQATELINAQNLVPSAIDNCSGTIILTKTSGSFVPVGTGGAGSYTNTWIATDVAGNISATSFTQIVTIGGVSIDASATSTAIQLGTATKTLTATVTSGIIPVNVATVTFTVTNNVNGNVNTVATVSATTGSNGVATYNLNSASLPVGLYAVTAVAGSGCAQSTAYFSVYDPNAGFVTGGGWINSPAGAYSADPTLTGKANFGFNAQYKKGNNTPDGNTEFQFKAGDLNFKSSNYSTGSLVIAGAKAIFQGTGTINGSGNYNFMVSAIDGSVSGGGGIDKFRIKIWTSGSGVVYDNNMGALDNGDPSTVLGGGSIVIHNAKNSSNRITNTSIIAADTIATANTSIGIDQYLTVKELTVKVMPNPAPLFFTLNIQSPDNGKIKITVVDIAGRVIEQRTDVSANSTIQIGSSYHPGVYFAEVMQGKVKIVLRLIKGRD
jgi:hypothetical protein